MIAVFLIFFFFFFQAEDGIRDHCVTGVQTCALPILLYVLFSWKIPPSLCNDPFSTSGAWLNLPALLITLAVTVILVIGIREDRKSTRLNSSHTVISYAVFCLKKKKQKNIACERIEYY